MIPLSTITLVEQRDDGSRRESPHDVNALFADPARVLGAWAELRVRRQAQLVVRWDRGGNALEGVCAVIVAWQPEPCAAQTPSKPTVSHASANLEAPDLDEIGIGLGADWIPQRVLEDWLYSLFPGETWGITLERCSASWLLTQTNPRLSEHQLGTNWLESFEILEAALNCRLPIVEDETDRGPVRNQAATLEAHARIHELRAAFETWVRSDAVGKSGQTGEQRRVLLETTYCSRFCRTSVAPDPPVELPELASIVDDKRYRLRPGQLAGVAKILVGGEYDRSTLLAYPPGYGKTDPAICAAMELLRTGKTRQTLVAVPSGVVGQWVARWVALYLGSVDRLLSPTCPRYGLRDGGLSGYLRRAASGRWSIVFVSHEQLGALLPSLALLDRVLEGELSEHHHALREAESCLSRQAQILCRATLRSRRAALGRVADAVAAKRRDDLPAWDDLGVDHLIVDEVQAFRALPVETRMEGLSGLPTRESARAWGLYLKTQALLRHSRDGRVTALSGTPLENTLAEAYVWMRMLQPGLLREVGLLHFDAWASVFCEPYSSAELDCVGRFRSRTRLRFRNVPELLGLLGECWSFARED